jgi:hypothetical protein
MVNEPAAPKRGRSYFNLLLLIPFIATLWIPFYASGSPEWAGIPFFYWYMFLWIILSSVITGAVYLLTE